MFKMKTLVLSMFARPYPQTEPCQAVLTSFAAPCSSLSTFFPSFQFLLFQRATQKSVLNFKQRLMLFAVFLFLLLSFCSYFLVGRTTHLAWGHKLRLMLRGRGCPQTRYPYDYMSCWPTMHTSSLAKSNNTFSELEIRFKWFRTRLPILSSFYCFFGLSCFFVY